MILAFPLLWALGAVAGYLYAKDRGIPLETAFAVLPAFLLEISFFYTLGYNISDSARGCFDRC